MAANGSLESISGSEDFVGDLMTKTAARKYVYLMTVRSLRSKNIRTADIGLQATQKDVIKVKEAMNELADKLEKKLVGRSKADASGENKSSETEVPVVCEPKA